MNQTHHKIKCAKGSTAPLFTITIFTQLSRKACSNRMEQDHK